jgi:hypothetical protein
LAETGDAEAFSNVVAILSLALRFIFVKDAAPLCSSDADDQVQIVFLRQLGLLLGYIAVILRWNPEPCAVVDAVVVEEHTINLVPLVQRGLGELDRRIGGLVLIRTFINQNR